MRNESQSRVFKIPVKIVLEGARQGLPLEKFKEMVRRSARISHAEGNRRYHDYLFQVDAGVVKSFRKMTEVELLDIEYAHEVKFKCLSCNDTKKLTVYDECPDCHGSGCSACSYTAQVKNQIACPDCAPAPLFKTRAELDNRRIVR